MTLNQWNLIDCVYDGSLLSVYTNGVLTGTTTDSTNPNANATDDFYFGNGGNGATNPLFGGLDKIRVYDRALSPSDISQLYDQPPE